MLPRPSEEGDPGLPRTLDLILNCGWDDAVFARCSISVIPRLAVDIMGRRLYS